MKRNIVLYILPSLCILFFVAVAVIGFVYHRIAAGVLALLLVLIAAIALLCVILQDNLNIECDRKFRAREFEDLRKRLEAKMRSPFFFLVRVIALHYYVCVCMALDDLPTAARYIDRLRHGTGAGWRYKTAYCYILIKLDAGDEKTAKTEFEEFRRWCMHAEVYRVQLEVLQAIFERLLTAKKTSPLPEAAVNSYYPVVGRILGRTYEEGAVS